MITEKDLVQGNIIQHDILKWTWLILSCGEPFTKKGYISTFDPAAYDIKVWHMLVYSVQSNRKMEIIYWETDCPAWNLVATG